MSTFFRVLTTTNLLLFVYATHATASDITWPEYSQQCRDDAGPPFLDDSESFNGGKYHDGSAATPVLPSDGSCPTPLKTACSNRPSIKTAYIEGPIDCGNQGWYCRIFKEPGWPTVNLVGDYNFGQCNTTENFEDGGTDKDGHCHGSSKDNTYYWWIRDHWHRAYNGRVRCCCGWGEGTSTTPLTDGRIANRCDYRRLVTQEEDLNACRDANEDHGKSYEGGCDAQYNNQIGSPIPEDDGICWEISKFGYSEGIVNGPTASPTSSFKPTNDNENDNDEEGDDDDYYEDDEDPNDIFTWKRRNQDKKLQKQTCGWLQLKKWKQKRKFCTVPKFNLFIEGQQQPASEVCSETCSPFCVKQVNKSKFYAGTKDKDGVTVAKVKNCKWLNNQNIATQEKYCASDYKVEIETVFVPAYKVCTSTCDSCGDNGTSGGTLFHPEE